MGSRGFRAEKRVGCRALVLWASGFWFRVKVGWVFGVWGSGYPEPIWV